jgi:hypothetical protein
MSSSGSINHTMNANRTVHATTINAAIGLGISHGERRFWLWRFIVVHGYGHPLAGNLQETFL